MATKIINCTPHEVAVFRNGEVVLRIPASGILPRCATSTEVVGTATTPEGVQVPLTRTSFGEVQGLPDPAADTLYVVSRLVISATQGRTDLVSPDGAVRDDQGRIIGCTALAF